MQMLVGDVQGRARNRQREHGGYHGYGCPLGRLLCKQLRGDAARGPQNDEERGELPEQLRPGHWNSRPANEMSHPAVEDGGLHLQLEEIRIVGVESGIQVGLYGGQIDSVVLEAGMVAHHNEAEHGKRENGQELNDSGFHARMELPSQATERPFQGELCSRWHFSVEAPKGEGNNSRLDEFYGIRRLAGPPSSIYTS